MTPAIAIRWAAYVAVSVVSAAYAVDAPLWVGAAIVGSALAPVVAQILYFRFRGADGRRGF
jgi:hypothetical protein